MTIYEYHHIEDGAAVAAMAVDHVAVNAEQYCQRERERIGLVNAPLIQALRVEGENLNVRRKILEGQLAVMPLPANSREKWRRVIYYGLIGIVLAVAALVLAYIGLAPYHLGRTGVIICAAIAIGVLFAIDEFLTEITSVVVRRVLVVTVFATALLASALLSHIRADQFARTADSETASVVIDGENPTQSPERQSFYESNKVALDFFLLFLAVLLDLGSGIAVHRCRMELAAVNGDYDRLAVQLSETRHRLIEIVNEITTLVNAPKVFEAKFWRDFYSAVLSQTVRKAVAKGIAIILLAGALINHHATAAERSNIAVALDLSNSESIAGPDGKTALQKNVQAIEKMLSTIPPNSHITILPIAKSSIATPSVLMTADVADNPGYFGDTLNTARATLVRLWRARAAKLEANERGTDIIGAIHLAAEVLRSSTSSERKRLIIFSDMRNATTNLDLESMDAAHINSALAGIEAKGLLVDLRGVTVYVSGANGGTDGDIRIWQALRAFWTGYFEKSGGHSASYAVLAMPPDLTVPSPNMPR